MKELLLKYNILPDTLTKTELQKFDDFVRLAMQKDFSEFENFLLVCSKRNEFVTQSLSDIRKNIKELIINATDLLEEVTPQTNYSVLLSFKRPSDTAELVARHQSLIVNISQVIDELSALEYRCSKIISESDYDPYIELKLRKIALDEAHENSDLSDLFEVILKNAEYIDPKKVNDALTNHAKIAETTVTVLKKLCVDTESALNSIKNGNAALSTYDRVTRCCMSILHDILINICQL